MPIGLSLCLALDDVYLHLNQLAHREQGLASISSPMKLHWSLRFASLRVFVSPVQSLLLQGSPRLNGFHSLDYRSYRVGNKAECPKEQTHQLGSQPSNTSHYANSPKRHETVMIEKTKRTTVTTVGRDCVSSSSRRASSRSLETQSSRSTVLYYVGSAMI